MSESWDGRGPQAVAAELLEALAAEATRETADANGNRNGGASPTRNGHQANGAGYKSRLLVKKWLSARASAIASNPRIHPADARFICSQNAPSTRRKGRTKRLA
jgi:hypothetical protein